MNDKEFEEFADNLTKKPEPESLSTMSEKEQEELGEAESKPPTADQTLSEILAFPKGGAN